MRIAIAASLVPLALAVAALDAAPVAPFSAAAPGAAMPPGWFVVTIPGHKAPEFALVPDEQGRTVLRVRADAAAGSLVHRLEAEPRATLAWRWKVDHALDKARLGTKEGDDFAGRVYVSFDVPLASLAFAERTKVRIARLFYGDSVPTAAICYVWDNRNPPGTSVWNPYSGGRLRMVVLESGNARSREWVEEARDIDADFKAAFGAQWRQATPRITGIAVSADTDQTGESVTAWFGDLRLERQP